MLIAAVNEVRHGSARGTVESRFQTRFKNGEGDG